MTYWNKRLKMVASLSALITCEADLLLGSGVHTVLTWKKGIHPFNLILVDIHPLSVSTHHDKEWGDGSLKVVISLWRLICWRAVVFNWISSSNGVWNDTRKYKTLWSTRGPLLQSGPSFFTYDPVSTGKPAIRTLSISKHPNMPHFSSTDFNKKCLLQ